MKRTLAEELGIHALDDAKAMLMTLLCRVEIRSVRVDITLSRCRLTELLAGSIDLKMQLQEPTNASGDILRLTVPVDLKRVGRELRMLVENADDETAPDPRSAWGFGSGAPGCGERARILSKLALTGKLTGNFADSGPWQRFWRPVSERIQWLASGIPYATEQGIFEA